MLLQRRSLKRSRMLRKYLFSVCLFALLYEAVSEYGCPPPEDIVPCTCRETYYTDLMCQNIFEVGTLVSVFEKAERYHFNKFTVTNSSLQYIPHQIFKNVEVKNMQFKDVSFVHTFDVVPNNPGVEIVSIGNVRVIGGWKWENLRVFNQLEDLSIEDVPLKRLSTTFQPNIPKSLKKLRLNWCEVKRFRDNEFAPFKELEEFSATHDVLTTMKRSWFASPSKLVHLSFEYNRITAIPVDMFTNMPGLSYISLANNQIAVLPEKAFKPVYDNLSYLHLHDNNIKCDCLIYWLISHKPDVLSGTCKTPKALNGKELNALKYEDFRC